MGLAIRFLAPVFPLLLAALLAGCSRTGEEHGSQKTIAAFPLTEYLDTTVLDMHDGSRLGWKLKTLHLVRWADADLVHAVPVDLSMFDSLGRPVMEVTADSGSVDEAVNFLMAQGHVHGRSSKGMDLRTDSLRWSKSLNQVTTEARVHVVSENGDTLTGNGFISDANLDHWQILSDVKGVFQQAADRADGGATGPKNPPPDPLNPP